MNSILYGNLRLEVYDRAGSRVDRLAGRPPPGLSSRLRQAPKSVPARPAGRDEVRRAVQAQRPAGLFGTCGPGWTPNQEDRPGGFKSDTLAVYYATGF